jgi:hypothetical protein
MRFFLALETVMSRTGRPIWLNCVLVAACLLALAAITTGSGLGPAGTALIWVAILPLSFGVFLFADGVREEMKARA